ncbi:MAG: hypothetical protein RI539_01300 [Spiribacter sp.]|nr:hypothetical protein [Spiribacter sp.]MDR9488963.1 hypothetical protein [Spiribacter sp.]
MAVFRARQVARIRDGVVAGRNAVRAWGKADAHVFARAFVDAGGAQVPGDPDASASAALAKRLLKALGNGEPAAPDDPDLNRELQRAQAEAQWALSLDDDHVVGFLLDLPATALENPTVEALAHQSQGLGPGVFRKADVLVLQPECDGARFIPISEHDIEC